jgi:hypothetical protein
LQKPISTNGIFLNVKLLSFTIFFDLEKRIFGNFNIYENNKLLVELAEVSRVFCFGQHKLLKRLKKLVGPTKNERLK